jgi:Domain of unknown function (DUF3597)
VLADMASKKGGGENYRESIVDLLKVLDLDSSLNARKELAQELKRERRCAWQCRAEHCPAQGGDAEGGGKRRQSAGKYEALGSRTYGCFN